MRALTKAFAVARYSAGTRTLTASFGAEAFISRDISKSCAGALPTVHVPSMLPSSHPAALLNLRQLHGSSPPHFSAPADANVITTHPTHPHSQPPHPPAQPTIQECIVELYSDAISNLAAAADAVGQLSISRQFSDSVWQLFLSRRLSIVPSDAAIVIVAVGRLQQGRPLTDREQTHFLEKVGLLLFNGMPRDVTPMECVDIIQALGELQIDLLHGLLMSKLLPIISREISPATRDSAPPSLNFIGLLYGLSQLQYSLPPQAQEALCNAVLLQLWDPSVKFNGRVVSRLVRAVAAATHRPATDWLQQLVDGTMERLHDFEPCDLVVFMEGLRKMAVESGSGVVIERVAMAGVAERFLSCQAEMTVEKVARGGAAIVQMMAQVAPRSADKLKDAVFSELHPKLERLNVEQLLSALHCFAEVGLAPPPHIMEGIEGHMIRQWSPDAGAQQLPRVLQLFKKLGHQPTEQFQWSVPQQMPEALSVPDIATLKPAELVAYLEALAAVKAEPPRGLSKAITTYLKNSQADWDPISPKPPSIHFTPSDISRILTAARTINLSMNRNTVTMLLDHLLPQIRYCTTEQLVGIMRLLYSKGYKMDEEAADVVFRHAMETIEDFGPRNFCRFLHAASPMGYRLKDGIREQLLSHVSHVISGCSTMDVMDLLRTFVKFPLHPNQEVLGHVVRHVGVIWDKFSERQKEFVKQTLDKLLNAEKPGVLGTQKHRHNTDQGAGA